MSAGAAVSYKKAARTDNLDLLAPLFRDAVVAAIAECNAAPNYLNAIVYETYRSNALQFRYYQRGRTVKPPFKPVTNAASNAYSWHGYGLAVDVVHSMFLWSPGIAWFRRVAKIFKRHGCNWGGGWKTPDYPHFQWGRCRATPSARARSFLELGGVEAVWIEVGAVALKTAVNK
jgi:peptidoglycan L-alanyl-D-glutamate endopeptidase CwlK